MSLSTNRKYDTMYMEMARAAARQSRCPRKQVGFVFVLESGVVAPGFNGHASGGPNEWAYKPDGDPEVVHAELNALGKCLEQGLSTKGATGYGTLICCLECAKLVVRAGVKRIVYDESYRKTDGLDYLIKYGVEVEKYEL